MYVQLCRRRVQTCTLFYMPHCGKAMYNNLLWANWSPQNLSQVALIGNSFQSYMERSVMYNSIQSNTTTFYRTPHRVLREKAPFIFKLCVRGIRLYHYVIITNFNHR